MDRCFECVNEAIAQIREAAKLPIYLCANCAVRYVRVAPVRGLLLTIEGFDKDLLESPTPDTHVLVLEPDPTP